MSSEQKKLTIGAVVILFVVAFVAVRHNGSVYTATVASAIQAPEIQRVIDLVPGPIKDFINSAKQIGNKAANRTARLDFSIVNPANLYDKVDTWFSNITGGTSLRDVVQFVGNFFVWTLTLIVDLIKWGLSFL